MKKLIILSSVFLFSVFATIGGVYLYNRLSSMPTQINSKQDFSGLLTQGRRLVTDRTTYMPYQAVHFISGVSDSYVQIVDQNGVIQQDIFQQVRIELSQDNSIYVAKWYPLNPHYEGQLIGQLYKDNVMIAEYPFFIKLRNNYLVPQNSIFLGLNVKDTITDQKILSVTGKETNITHLTEWMSLFGNDTVVMPAVITKSFDKTNTTNWDEDKFQESLQLAKKFASENKKTALYIQALKIEGNLEFSDYQPSRNTLNLNDIISIKDTNRQKELKSLVNILDSNKDVSYIGMSEALFSKDQHLSLDSDFKNEFDVDIINEIAFQRWKEYKIVEYYRNIFRGVKKPKFFMVKGKDVVQNTNVLAMAFGAGADFVMLDLDAAIDVVDVNLDIIKKTPSFNKLQDAIVFSYQIDYNNLFEPQVSAIDNWTEKNIDILNNNGIRAVHINDFYRAIYGNRGSYPSYQWLLAIADFTARWRDSRQILSLQQNMILEQRDISSNYTVNLELENLTDAAIADYTVSLLPNEQILFSLPKIKSREVLRTNFTIAGVVFKPSILKSRTRYISLNIKYKDKKTSEFVKLLAVTDPMVQTNYMPIEDSNFNQEIRMIIEQEEIKRQQEALSNKLAEEQRAREQEEMMIQKQQEEEDRQQEEIEAQRLKEEEEQKKLPWWKRRRK